MGVDGVQLIQFNSSLTRRQGNVFFFCPVCLSVFLSVFHENLWKDIGQKSQWVLS